MHFLYARGDERMVRTDDGQKRSLPVSDVNSRQPLPREEGWTRQRVDSDAVLLRDGEGLRH